MSQAAGNLAQQARRRLMARRIPDLLYGGVVAGSVLAISSIHAPGGEHVALATAGVTVVYWLAHVYVEAVGGRFEDQENATHVRLATAVKDNVEVLIGAVPPIVVFLLARLLGLDVRGAAWVALWFTFAMLTFAGALAAYLAGARRWALVAEASLAGVFGLLVILLKYALH